MNNDLYKRVRSKKFDLAERYLDDVIKDSHRIFQRIAKTAVRYSVTGEPASVLIESAKVKHANSLAGLMGSMHGGMLDMPFNYENEEQREEWAERGWGAYKDFEGQYTRFLERELDTELSKQEFRSSWRSASPLIVEKVRWKKAPVREAVSDGVQSAANAIWRNLVAATSRIEILHVSATESVDSAFEEVSEQLASLLGQLKVDLSENAAQKGCTQNQALERADEVMSFFVRDLRQYLVQEIVELRTERIENAQN